MVVFEIVSLWCNRCESPEISEELSQSQLATTQPFSEILRLLKLSLSPSSVGKLTLEGSTELSTEESTDNISC